MGLFNTAGGVLYHGRAVCYSRLWKPFRSQISDWLGTWQCPKETLVLVAPSAGYSLPTDWLLGFKNVVAIDVDPISPMFFKMAHPGVNTDWRLQDCFPLKGDSIDWGPLFKAIPDQSTVLFCNVLGQLYGFERFSQEIIQRSLVELKDRLNGCAWASYHDRLSADAQPDRERLENSHLADHSLRVTAFGWNPLAEIENHLTGSLGKSMPCHYMAWQRLPHYWHLIEGVRST